MRSGSAVPTGIHNPGLSGMGSIIEQMLKGGAKETFSNSSGRSALQQAMSRMPGGPATLAGIGAVNAGLEEYNNQSRPQSPSPPLPSGPSPSPSRGTSVQDVPRDIHRQLQLTEGSSDVPNRLDSIVGPKTSEQDAESVRIANALRQGIQNYSPGLYGLTPDIALQEGMISVEQYRSLVDQDTSPSVYEKEDLEYLRTPQERETQQYMDAPLSGQAQALLARITQTESPLLRSGLANLLPMLEYSQDAGIIGEPGNQVPVSSGGVSGVGSGPAAQEAYNTLVNSGMDGHDAVVMLRMMSKYGGV